MGFLLRICWSIESGRYNMSFSGHGTKEKGADEKTAAPFPGQASGPDSLCEFPKTKTERPDTGKEEIDMIPFLDQLFCPSVLFQPIRRNLFYFLFKF